MLNIETNMPNLKEVRRKLFFNKKLTLIFIKN